MNICYLVERAGPYHLFRLGAITAHKLSVIETNSVSDIYEWKEKLVAGFPLFSPVLKHPETLDSLLDSLKPDVIFLTGYGFKEMLWGMAWAIRNKVPIVMQSDSTELDAPRQRWKELIKKGIVANVQAALIAGSRSRKYLLQLGLGEAAVFEPYDIIDNDFFSAPDTGLSLPEKPYFLCVSRLIRVKNLEFLIRSFALFNAQNPEKYKLVLLGNGPLEESLNALIVKLKLEKLVFMKGFLHMNEVRRYYKQASGLILASISEPWGLCINEAIAAGLPVIASVNAGATEDLIFQHQTGWTFSPFDSASLVEAMHHCAGLLPAEKENIITGARECLKNYTIEKFITGINNSASYAIKNPGTGKFKKLRAFLIYQTSMLFS